MERRNFLIGSAATGVGLFFGTGAFSAAGAGHGVSIGTGDGYIHVEPNDDYAGDVDEYVDDPANGPLEVIIDDIDENGWVRFDDLLLVTNTGTQSVDLYVEEQDWLGDDDAAILDYRIGDESIVGETNAVSLGSVEDGDNSETITLRADLTDHDDVEAALPSGDESTVMFVADSSATDGGDDTGDEDDEGSGDEQSSGEFLEVAAPSSVDVREVAEITATVTNETGGQQEATVTLDVEGVDPGTHYGTFEETVTVADGSSEDVVFEIPTEYEDVEKGGLTLQDNEWAVSAEIDADTDELTGSLSVNDAAVQWYQPDGDKICPVCNMLTETYEAWHAQATHVDGSRIEFCSLGCAVEYWVNPTGHDGSGYDGKHDGTIEDELVTIWAPDFTDVETGEYTDSHPGWEAFIDMREGYFVLDENTASKFNTPMSGSPVCFASHDDALAYVDEWDDVTEDDIVELEDLVDEHGLMYRANYR